MLGTGILKDYLRELPSSLITATLYEVVTEAMIRRPPPVPPASPDLQLAENTVALLSCLPAAEKVRQARRRHFQIEPPRHFDPLSFLGHFDSAARPSQPGGVLQLVQQDDAPKPGSLFRPGAPQTDAGGLERRPGKRRANHREGFVSRGGFSR